VLAALLLAGHNALSWIYFVPVGLASIDLMVRNIRLLVHPDGKQAFSLFKASNLYLALILLMICVNGLI
jgi:heme O synthase-like polyprenyltransferase